MVIGLSGVNRIGRRDKIDRLAINSLTVSGTGLLVPTSPLQGRDYIKIINTGSSSVALNTTLSGTYSEGYIIPANGEFSDYVKADIYAICDTGNSTTIKIYERSSK